MSLDRPVGAQAPGQGGRAVLVVHPSVELYGADRMLLESVRALVDSGHRVTVALPGSGPLTDALRDLDCDVVALDVPVLRKSLLSASGLVRLAGALLAAAPRQARLLRETGVEVVYVNTVTIPSWIAVSRLLGRSVVCHVHEAEESASSILRTGLAAPLLLADVVLANSRASRDVVGRDLPRLASRIRVVYNGFEGPAHPTPVRAEPTPPVRLLLLGRVSPRKGTDVAVDALRLLVADGVDAVLDVVGGVFTGYEWFQEQVEQQVAAAGLGERVRWRGEVPDPYAALDACDVALVPSRVEPFGNTAVEALLSERPLVVSGAQGLVEVVRDGRDAEVVAPDDPAALAGGVRALLGDWPAAVARAARAADEARVRFSRARYAQEIVDSVTAAGSRRRRSRRAAARAGAPVSP